MSEEPQYPLVTFALFAYNQEKYIREAVEGALAQDYPNLEIIISDDCSTDGTFQEALSALSRASTGIGVRLVRQDSNLGIAAHVNAVMKLVSGELVVVAAGDDVSRPDRISALVEKWVALEKIPGVLHSACMIIDELGQSHGVEACTWENDLVSAQTFLKSNQRIVGATAAWVPEIFSFFGELDENIVNEDRAIPFRSLLLGRPIAYVDLPLVSYRRGTGISTMYWKKNIKNRSQRIRVLRVLRQDALQKMADLKKAPSDALQVMLSKKLATLEVNLWFESGFPSWSEISRTLRITGVFPVIRSSVKFLANASSEFAKNAMERLSKTS